MIDLYVLTAGLQRSRDEGSGTRVPPPPPPWATRDGHDCESRMIQEPLLARRATVTRGSAVPAHCLTRHHKPPVVYESDGSRGPSRAGDLAVFPGGGQVRWSGVMGWRGQGPASPLTQRGTRRRQGHRAGPPTRGTPGPPGAAAHGTAWETRSALNSQPSAQSQTNYRGLGLVTGGGGCELDPLKPAYLREISASTILCSAANP